MAAALLDLRSERRKRFMQTEANRVNCICDDSESKLLCRRF